MLNLAKRPDDVSLPYFERYPLACTVLEREGTDLRVCARVRAFLHKNAGRQLPFAQVERAVSLLNPFSTCFILLLK